MIEHDKYVNPMFNGFNVDHRWKKGNCESREPIVDRPGNNSSLSGNLGKSSNNFCKVSDAETTFLD